jgi:hypothetical protein
MSPDGSRRRSYVTSPDVEAIFSNQAKDQRQHEHRHGNWQRDQRLLTSLWERWAKEAYGLEEAARLIRAKAFSQDDSQRHTNEKQAFARDFVPIAAQAALAIGEMLGAQDCRRFAKRVASLVREPLQERSPIAVDSRQQVADAHSTLESIRRNARVIAIDVLKAAVVGEAETVHLLLRKAFDARLALGESVVLYWLADKLRFEVLGVLEDDPRLAEIPSQLVDAIADEQFRRAMAQCSPALSRTPQLAQLSNHGRPEESETRHRDSDDQRQKRPETTSPLDDDARMTQVEIATKSASGDSKRTVKSKKSTASGEAREKLTSKILAHHKYENGSCGNFHSIGVRELARDVCAPSTAKDFFVKVFGGHEAYKISCRQPGKLAFSLRLLAGDVLPKHLDLDPTRYAQVDNDADD